MFIWHTAHSRGGMNTFNEGLCMYLARVVRIECMEIFIPGSDVLRSKKYLMLAVPDVPQSSWKPLYT